MIVISIDDIAVLLFDDVTAPSKLHNDHTLVEFFVLSGRQQIQDGHPGADDLAGEIFVEHGNEFLTADCTVAGDNGFRRPHSFLIRGIRAIRDSRLITHGNKRYFAAG